MLRRGVARAVQELVLNRASFQVLRDRVLSAGGELTVWPDSGNPATNVAAGETGTVIDIDMDAMTRCVRDASVAGNDVTVGVWLGQRIGQFGVIAASTSELPADTRERLRRSVVICTSRATTLDDDLRDLHDEALDQIARPGGENVVDQVLDTYTEVLHDYARAWLAYADEVGTDTLPSFMESPAAPLDAIRNSVRDLYVRSIESGDRASAFSIVYFPVGIATRAIEWRSPAYFQLVSLYPQFYVLADRGQVDVDTRRIFTERSWWHPVEALELMIPALMRTVELDEQDLSPRLRNDLHRALFNVFRLCVRNGDIQNFREGVRRWRLANR